jgi:hypothetical protein
MDRDKQELGELKAQLEALNQNLQKNHQERAKESAMKGCVCV